MEFTFKLDSCLACSQESTTPYEFDIRQNHITCNVIYYPISESIYVFYETCSFIPDTLDLLYKINKTNKCHLAAYTGLVVG